jgi:hypothetical protein
LRGGIGQRGNDDEHAKASFHGRNLARLSIRRNSESVRRSLGCVRDDTVSSRRLEKL